MLSKSDRSGNEQLLIAVVVMAGIGLPLALLGAQQIRADAHARSHLTDQVTP